MLPKTYHVMFNEVKHLAKLLTGFFERSLTLAPRLNAKADAAGVDRWFA